MKKTQIIILSILMILAIVWAIWYSSFGNEKNVNNFDDCVALGGPIMELYPPICTAPDGRSFKQDVGNEMEKQDLIRIESPRPNVKISSPLQITGMARGNWFFEASFPIKLLDNSGNEIGSSIAQVEGDWMTTNFVRFNSTLEFNSGTSTKGFLILKKDNPSGLPEKEDELRIPVAF